MASEDAIGQLHELRARKAVLERQLSEVNQLLTNPEERFRAVALADFKLPPTAEPSDIAALLDRYGVCVVEGLIGAEQCEALSAQLDGLPQDGSCRGPAMALEAPLLQPLLVHPLVMAAARSILCRHCKQISMKVMDRFDVRPGQQRQLLHREDANFPANHQPYEWCIDALWALSDFSRENGATHLVPGSQTWPRTQPFERQDLAVQAVMPRGSVLLFVGATLHGGGANHTEATRRGILTGYQVGWALPEYRYWSYRPLHDRVRSLPPVLQSLFGFGEPTNSSGNDIDEDGGQAVGIALQPELDTSLWSASIGNYHYTGRTSEQAASDNDPAVNGNAGIDCPFYHGPGVEPAIATGAEPEKKRTPHSAHSGAPDPSDWGRYITRLHTQRVKEGRANPIQKAKY
jgi:hypothetical protein